MADISALVLAEALRLSEQLIVPTRIYFPSSGVADVTTIAFDAGWESTVSAVRRQAIVNGRKRGTAAASVNVVGTAANPEQQLHAQYVTRPLRGQTISGNVRGQFRALESAAQANATIQIGIRVVSQDGQTVRGTLLAVGGTTTTTATPPEFATSLTNRQLLTSGDVSPLPLSSVVCQEGDRLVIEIGHNNKDTSTTRNCDISFGDNTVDLLTDNTTTTAQDPWIEFDTTIAFQDQVEILTLDDVGQGVTQMMNQGWVKADDRSQVAVVLSGIASSLFDKEHVKVSDSVTAVLNLGVIVAQEALTPVDGPPSASRQDTGLSQTVTAENIKIADTATPALTPELASVSEAVGLTDTATAMIVLLANLQESIILDDIGQGIAQLLGVVHISDGPPIAALVSGNSLASEAPAEQLKISDTVTASRGLTASLTEPLTPVDSVTAIQDHTATPSESLKLADTPTTLLNPEQASVSEALRIADTVSASRTIDVTIAAEALRVVDAVLGPTLDPLQASGAEALRIQDQVQSSAFLQGSPADENLKIADGPPSARLNPLQATAALTEGLRIVDTSLTTRFTLLQVAAPSENVKISDRVNILQASINEQLRLSDTGRGIVQLIGTLRIQDTVIAQIGNQLSVAPSETLKLAEVLLQPERTPYEATVTEALKLGWTTSEAEYTRDEYVRVQDTVNVNLAAPGDLSTLFAETLKLADAASMNRDLERLAAEALTPADAVTAARDFEASLTEPLTPADAVTAIQDHIASVAEGLIVADSASGQVHPEEGAPTADALRILDAPSVSLSNPADESTSQAETVKVTESLQVARDLEATLEEAIGLGEVFDYGDGSLLLVALEEPIVIAEERDATMDLRGEAEQEDLRISDEIEATLALVVIIDSEFVRSSDADLLQLGLDLAIEVPGDPGPPVSSAAVTSTSAWDARTTSAGIIRTTQ